ncbi:unnamed protein product [Vitrella brassicaformis CCMP3155]|uniref:TFIIS central domain-containing protein n=1 Tax=Vitrella brassicaformis (strain CCMP3155) TaxID=1169540 RepID=A0A0G4G4H8_VITBC|nr:unnamed protein product [Vitrella brassicaformis CCMP3155]|eukprot:CEM23164.1 unnamed protein product [Vitrella brassicaformis CCMP3155]
MKALRPLSVPPRRPLPPFATKPSGPSPSAAGRSAPPKPQKKMPPPSAQKRRKAHSDPRSASNVVQSFLSKQDDFVAEADRQKVRDVLRKVLAKGLLEMKQAGTLREAKVRDPQDYARRIEDTLFSRYYRTATEYKKRARVLKFNLDSAKPENSSVRRRVLTLQLSLDDLAFKATAKDLAPDSLAQRRSELHEQQLQNSLITDNMMPRKRTVMDAKRTGGIDEFMESTDSFGPSRASPPAPPPRPHHPAPHKKRERDEDSDSDGVSVIEIDMDEIIRDAQTNMANSGGPGGAAAGAPAAGGGSGGGVDKGMTKARQATSLKVVKKDLGKLKGAMKSKPSQPPFSKGGPSAQSGGRNKPLPSPSRSLQPNTKRPAAKVPAKKRAAILIRQDDIVPKKKSGPAGGRDATLGVVEGGPPDLTLHPDNPEVISRLLALLNQGEEGGGGVGGKKRRIANGVSEGRGEEKKARVGAVGAGVGAGVSRSFKAEMEMLSVRRHAEDAPEVEKRLDALFSTTPELDELMEGDETPPPAPQSPSLSIAKPPTPPPAPAPAPAPASASSRDEAMSTGSPQYSPSKAILPGSRLALDAPSEKADEETTKALEALFRVGEKQQQQPSSAAGVGVGGGAVLSSYRPTAPMSVAARSGGGGGVRVDLPGGVSEEEVSKCGVDAVAKRLIDSVKQLDDPASMAYHLGRLLARRDGLV